MAVRGPGVLGRDELVADVCQRLGRDSRVVVLVGEPGIGKTTVWAETLDRMPAEWTWSTRCLQVESDLGLAVLADLYAAVPDSVLSVLPPAQRWAVDVVLFRADAPVDAAIGDRLLGAATLSLLGELARHGQAIIGIDDLQWCDSASFRALDFAVHRLADTSLRVIATTRSGGMVEFADAVTVGVLGLSDDEVRQIVRAQAGRDVAESAIVRAVGLSAGNPFFARELGRQLGADPGAARLPATLRAALGQRLDTVSSAGRAVLLEIAVLGAPRDDLIDANLGELIGADIVTVNDGVVRFTHPLLVNAVLESARRTQIRRAHARAADLLADPVAAALHLAQASAPDESVAVRLDAAAELATGRGDGDSGRRLADYALELTSVRPRPRHRLTRAAKLHFAVGNLARVEELGHELLADAVEPDEVATAMQYIGGSLDDNDDAIAMLLDAAGIEGLSVELHRSIVNVTAHVMQHSGRAAEAVVLLDDLLRSAGAEDSAALIAWSVTLRRFLGLRYDEQLLRTAVDAERRWAAETAWVGPRGFGAIGAAGLLAFLDDRHHEAQLLLAEASDIAARHGEADETAYFAALLSFRRGRLRAAAQQLREAMADDGPNAAPLARLAMVHVWLGEQQLAKDCIAAARSVPCYSDRDPAIAETGFAEGLLLLFDGRADAAWPVLQQVAAHHDAISYREPSHPPVLPAAIEAAAAVGDLAAAEGLCRRLEQQSEVVASGFGHAAARRSRGFVALAQGADEQAASCFADSVQLFAEIDVPLERARAQLALGSLLRRRGQRRRARESLEAARVTFADCSAVDCTHAAQVELGAISGRLPPDAGVLTSSEQRIVELVATGLTNKQVARDLHLSVKTVEAHLNRAFRKLGVSNRTEMTRRFAAPDPDV